MHQTLSSRTDSPKKRELRSAAGSSSKEMKRSWALRSEQSSSGVVVVPISFLL
jgi:hypothetical protein